MRKHEQWDWFVPTKSNECSWLFFLLSSSFFLFRLNKQSSHLDWFILRNPKLFSVYTKCKQYLSKLIKTYDVFKYFYISVKTEMCTFVCVSLWVSRKSDCWWDAFNVKAFWFYCTAPHSTQITITVKTKWGCSRTSKNDFDLEELNAPTLLNAFSYIAFIFMLA